MTQEFEALRTATNQTDHEQASRQYAKMVCGQDCNQESLSDYKDEDFVAYQQRGLQPPVLPDDYELYKMVKEYWMQEADCYLGKSDKSPTTRGKDADGQLQDNAPKNAAEGINEGKSEPMPDITTPTQTEILKKNFFEKNGVSEDAIVPKDLWLDFSLPYEQNTWCFELDGTPLIRIGELSVVSGKFGTGKSQLISMLIAAALCGQYGTLKCLMPQTPICLLIDTEQGLADVVAEKSRILEIAGLDTNKPTPYFHILRLRSIDDVNEIWKFVLQAVKQLQPDIIVIDGLLDTVEDFNNIGESAEVTRRCMKIAEIMQCAVIGVLHQNPNSEKATGHLGSVALRKATDFLSVSREGKGTDAVYSVSSQKARGHAMIDKWHFRITNTGLWGRPEPCMPASSGTEISIEDIEQTLRAAQGTIDQPCTAQAIKNWFKSQLSIKDNNLAQQCYEMALNRGFITKQSKEEYEPNQHHPKLYLTL